MDGNMPRPPLQPEENPDAWLTLSLALPAPPPPLPPLPPLPPPAPSRPLPTEHILPFAPPPHMQYPSFFLPYPLPPPQVNQTPEQKPELELLPRFDFPYPKEEDQEAARTSSRRQLRGRAPIGPKNPTKPDTITPPPFPWATPTRATVHSLQHLLAQGLTTISGTVQCKVCQTQRDIELDLEEKFQHVTKFIRVNSEEMHDRAPECWMSPVLPTCYTCGRVNVSRPVITKKRTTNWLFLLLGQLIGCCSLDHLRYFCKHTGIHRTGAKDRLVYLTYLGLCKQLQPDGPFDP